MTQTNETEAGPRHLQQVLQTRVSARHGGRYWMVRAGPKGAAAAEFQASRVIATGWLDVDWTLCADSSAIHEKLREVMPRAMRAQRIAVAGQIERFIRGIRISDRAVSYDGRHGLFLLGIVTGEARFNPCARGRCVVERPVAWYGTAPRNDLSPRARNSLRAMSRIFEVTAVVAAELEAIRKPLEQRSG